MIFLIRNSLICCRHIEILGSQSNTASWSSALCCLYRCSYLDESGSSEPEITIDSQQKLCILIVTITNNASWKYDNSDIILTYVRWLLWNGNVIILTKFSSLAALKVVILTNFSVANGKNFIMMTTFSFQCHLVILHKSMYYLNFHISYWYGHFVIKQIYLRSIIMSSSYLIVPLVSCVFHCIECQ